MTLTDFLLARITERQRSAEAVAATTPTYPHHGDTAVECAAELARSEGVERTVTDYIAEMADTAHVIAECEAKRRIITESADYRPELSEGDNGEWAFGQVLTFLALPYADHPDYDEAWRPL